MMSALQRILCPIDFDEHSGRAVARARGLAARHHAELLLLHVLPLRSESILMPRPDVAAQVDRAASAHLGELAGMIREDGVRCAVATVHGDPAFQILQAARDGDADLIVMATHGRKGVPRVVLGSVTEAVLHATPCPLLTIPPRAAGDAAAFRRVLCAVDLSPSSPDTFAHALDMVEEAYGELTVLNVIDPAGTPAPDAAKADAEKALSLLHDRVPQATRWCRLRDAVRFGETVAEVLKQADEEQAHLIVVGARARQPGVAAMVGSCADRIVRESRCPVLAVPVPDPHVALPLLHPVYA
jgi:nucleotide-binding universal stress UspA family protein